MKHIVVGFLLLGIFAAAAITAEFKDGRPAPPDWCGAVPSHVSEVDAGLRVCH